MEDKSIAAAKAGLPEHKVSAETEPKAVKKKIRQFTDLDPAGIYSYADYNTWEFKDRIELIKGKIVQLTPVPSPAHEQLCGLVFVELYDYLIDQKAEVFVTPFDVRLPENSIEDDQIFTVVQPDVGIVCDPHKLDSKGCLGVPDVIIEILSPSKNKKDLAQKFIVYEEFGVKEYWTINPKEQTFFLYKLDGNGKYLSADPNGAIEISESSIFPDFVLSGDHLF